MDDPPPPYQAVEHAPYQGNMNQQPPVMTKSSRHAAGPRVQLQAGGNVQTQAGLSQEAKFSLKAILQMVKAKILPGSVVSDDEFAISIGKIFANGWVPGAFCEGERAIHKNNAPRSTKRERQAGADVNLMVEIKCKGQVGFSLRDGKSRIVSMDAPVTWICSMADGYFHAMQRNDQFMNLNVHRYNMKQAVYIC
ncbi:hypothetical protein KVR01_000727 [Diaporthe batatas]|uniref:uncharacterized protein n=1 Tax=Diaporthe batatas TaxID=748121 RepID=UPI001D04702A|nr:uncharacterized protein KVR01_000727 [Diaporthe batatas]KAG8169982.1 hypothetical protein KVR01_000727 [Diaporthe batatas]